MSKKRTRELIEFTIEKLKSTCRLHPNAVPNLIDMVEREWLAMSEDKAEGLRNPPSGDTHETTGGVDSGKNTGGYSGFSNGAK